MSCVQEGASRDFIDLDKAIYGLIDNITEKELYENITIFNDLNDLNDLNKCTKFLNGGNILEVPLNRNVSLKKISDMIGVLKDKYNGLVLFKIGSDKN